MHFEFFVNLNSYIPVFWAVIFRMRKSFWKKCKKCCLLSLKNWILHLTPNPYLPTLNPIPQPLYPRIEAVDFLSLKM